MTRLWIALLFIVGVSLAAVWLADHPGEVTMLWFGYRVDTSLAALALAFVVAGWLLLIVYAALRDIAAIPGRLSRRRELQHYRRGLAELTYSAAALAASDHRRAEKHAKKAERLLGETPMGLLIGAQIARGRGDDALTQSLLTKMLAHHETSDMAERLLTHQPTPSETSLGARLRRAWRRMVRL